MIECVCLVTVVALVECGNFLDHAILIGAYAYDYKIYRVSDRETNTLILCHIGLSGMRESVGCPHNCVILALFIVY